VIVRDGTAMYKLVGFLVLTTGILGWVSAGAKADSTIECPLDEVTSAIGESLPRGWDVVPQKLTDTHVDERGRRDTLQCIYGTVATLEFTAPRRERCTAEESGFECKSRRSDRRRQNVAANGALRIPAALSVDLDTGRLTRGNKADFRIKTEFPLGRQLVAINGARFAKSNSNDPNRRDCRRANYRGDRIALSMTPGANWTCYITNDGQAGRLRVTGIAIFPPALDIDFTTWE